MKGKSDMRSGSTLSKDANGQDVEVMLVSPIRLWKCVVAFLLLKT